MADEKYLVIARKWRPQRFEDVVGQEHITRTLQNAIRSGRVGHAFLFIGSRGIGKTTTARVLAKALNCERAEEPTPDPCCECHNCVSIAAGNNIDVIEIDGASNNSVEDVRQIREHIRLVPSRSRFKIYVIDEVHQLSASAFNALLKTIEEPPPHAVFILATTEAHKIPATIVSRCQRYDFRRAGIENVAVLLRRILEAEGIQADDEALYAIARAGDGSIRDSESILEQLVSYCDGQITFRDVYDVLGLVDWNLLNDLCAAILDKDVARQLNIVEEVVLQGKNLSQFVQDILHYFRNLLVCKTAEPKGLIALPDDEIATLQGYADRFALTDIICIVEQFAGLSKDFDSQLAQRIALESLLIRLSKVSVEVSIDTVLEKLVRLGAGGVDAPADAGERPARSVGAAAAALAAEAESAALTSSESEDARLPEPEEGAAPAIAVTSANLREYWPALREAASHHRMNLAAALDQALSASVEDDALVLEFGDGQASSRAIVERHENREAVESILAAKTSNLRRLRCEAAEPGPPPPGGEDPGQATLPFHSSVSAEQARQAMEDPGVAQLADTFKARVVDVQPPEPEDAE